VGELVGHLQASYNHHITQGCMGAFGCCKCSTESW
jgi:hypothetical protein